MNFSKTRILCVDDDVHTVDWISNTLKGSKINAALTAVKSSGEAFTLLNREGFDLCILEYALPDMTGVELCSLIRKAGFDVPIMFFTAMDRPIDIEKAHDAGADEYLRKPDDLNLFANSVARLLLNRYFIHKENKRLNVWAKAAQRF